jgi:cell wall assembly regulator SMI1
MLPGFDPSKLDPKVLMELTQLMRQLPPDRIMKMQTIMHNMMAGFDVRKEMEEFERTLPPDFREKLFAIMPSAQAGQAMPVEAETVTLEPEAVENLSVRDARLTILKAVAEGRVSPEDAERLLFPGT